VKKLLTAFAFGALIAGVAGFVTSPAFAADTGSSTGSTEPGTTTPKKHHKKSSHHHKKKSDTGTSSGTTSGTTTTTPPK
jgi:gas vesicle protein